MRVLFVTNQWPNQSKSFVSPFVHEKVESLRDLGVEVDVFDYRGSWNPLFYLQAMISLRQKLNKQSYDLVSSHFGQCGFIAVSQTRLPVVVRFGGSDLIGWKKSNGKEPLASKFLRLISRFAAFRASQVIIPGEHMAVHLGRKDYNVLPTGINLDLFYPMNQEECRLKLALPMDKKLVLFAADPTKVLKRFDLAKKIVDIAMKHHSIELIVASKIPHSQMPAYMNACDVLLLTSQHEGSPNVVKEALACNLSVVSVDVGDVRTRIGTANNCKVCDKDDPSEIAKALVDVLSQGKDSRLRNLVLELDSHKTALKELEIYHKAIGLKNNEKH